MAAARLSAVLGDEKPPQRSSSKADAIRRGRLRISGPILVQSDVEDTIPPADRNVVSMRVHEAVAERRSNLLRDANVEQPIAQDSANQNEQAHESAELSQYGRSSAAERYPSFPNGRISTYGHPYSMNLEPSSVRTSPKSDVKTEPRRKAKPGPLRAAVRRLFGRKSKTVQSEPAPASVRHGYHRSDPGGLLKLGQTVEPSPTPKRSFSMPIRDITPPMALQSHAPAVQFPRSRELKPLNLRTSIQRHSPRRRATLGSTAPNADNTGTLPKSFDDPFWDTIMPVEEREIGLAVTSGSNPKRRSRSAGALRDIHKLQAESSNRRRSEEIRYWRASTEERPMSGDSRYSGIAVGAKGPERRVNSMHYRDASGEQAPPLSPRYGRIFEFGPLNEDKIESTQQKSLDDNNEYTGVTGAPASNKPEDRDTTLLPEPADTSVIEQLRQPTLEEREDHWGQSQSPSLRRSEIKRPESPESNYGSQPASSAVALPLPDTPVYGDDRSFKPTSEATAPMPMRRPEGDLQPSSYFPDRNNVSTVGNLVSFRNGAYQTPEKRNENYEQPYAEDYTNLIEARTQPELPSPLSPNTSSTFEAVSNVLAHERAARKELEKIVYELRREVAELRSIIDRVPKLSAYGDRSINDEMRTYRSHSSETMDARKALERLEGYGRQDDHRITVIRSRFSGFESIGDSNGETNDDVDEHVQSASPRQEDQAEGDSEQHPQSPSAPSTELESPGSEAFETPTEEASGYTYAYDDDIDDVPQAPGLLPSMKVPVTVGGMF